MYETRIVQFERLFLAVSCWSSMDQEQRHLCTETVDKSFGNVPKNYAHSGFKSDWLKTIQSWWCVEDWYSAEYDFNKKLTRTRPKRSERNLQ